MKKTVNLPNVIRSWHPFSFLQSCCGSRWEYTFTCPHCGGHNLDYLSGPDKLSPFECTFRCFDCGNSLDERGNEINFYSNCISVKRLCALAPVQLNLFD